MTCGPSAAGAAANVKVKVNSFVSTGLKDPAAVADLNIPAPRLVVADVFELNRKPVMYA